MPREDYEVTRVEWESEEGEACRQIRFEVFVDEQKVPAELELDETDRTAFHVLARDRSGKACGTARLFADSHEPGTAHIGRMAVAAAARGTGCGSALLVALLQFARIEGYRRVTLSAQTHALPFYARHGFQAEGDEYLDAGIVHRRMSLQLQP